MPKYLALLAAFALTACAATQPVDMATPAKSAFAAKSAYAIALVVAGEYVSLKRCEAPAAPVVCSKQSIVNTIRKADLAADTATQAAEDAVRSLGEKPLLVDALVTSANAAVKAFSEIAATYKVKK